MHWITLGKGSGGSTDFSCGNRGREAAIGCHGRFCMVRLDAGGIPTMFEFDRRDFLRVTAAGAAGAAGMAMSRRVRAADKNGKLRLASIGTGGKGQDDLQNISASPRVEVVALCNV